MAAEVERIRRPPAGTGERFSGYGVLGLPFTLGHILAFRRVSASSVGPPYTSVWHRDPEGRWTVYADVEPTRSCARYFGAALARAVATDVQVLWTADSRLSVSVPEHHLEWALRVESSPRTRALNALAASLPDRALGHPWLLDRFGPLAGRALEAGPLRFSGRAPNGQAFRMVPSRLWTVSASAAVVRGRDVGPLGPHAANARLGDLVLPNRGLFVRQSTWFERLDPAVHRPAAARAPSRVS
ncbi:MAG: hypothetical protein GWN85_36170 [Gemmatimonadetes bacterium]|nr:hypothetical protein [Gemmatimonadota bacterium]